MKHGFKNIVRLKVIARALNQTTILNDLKNVEPKLKNYFKIEFQKLLSRKFIEEEIAANLEYSNHLFRLNRIVGIWKEILEA